MSNEFDEFIPASEDAWRDQNANHRSRKKMKTSGIVPKSFHKVTKSDKIKAMRQIKHKLKEGRKLVNNHDRIQTSLSLKERFQEFKGVTTYQQYPLQADAFTAFDELQKKCDATPQESNEHLWSLQPRVFASEKSGGKRKYIVCNQGRFMHRYWRQCEPYARHHYEVIQENTPCRLYFDLEYNTEANLDITKESNDNLMKEFIKELIVEVDSQFGITLREENMVDLDSTTAKKFSRHLIIHMPGDALFQDAMSCGVFVKNFVGRLAEELATGQLGKKCPTLAAHLFVNSKPESIVSKESQGTDLGDDGSEKVVGNHALEKLRNKSCFVDTGVYTRNRLFRLFGSSKFGKPASAALRIAASNQFRFPKDFGNHKVYVPDMEDALLSRKTRENARESDEDSSDKESEFQSHLDWEDYANALESTFVVPTYAFTRKNIQILHTKSTNHASGISIPRASSNRSAAANSQQNPRAIRPSSSYSNNLGPSPYPKLEAFINNKLANRKGANGAVRAWSVDSSSSLNNNKQLTMIIYQIKGNRYCENIQRFHKSNNVMWNVSLVDMTYWQTCHDPECRMLRFRGEANMLPNDVQDEIRQVAADKSFEIDDEFEDALASLHIPGVTD